MQYILLIAVMLFSSLSIAIPYEYYYHYMIEKPGQVYKINNSNLKVKSWPESLTIKKLSYRETYNTYEGKYTLDYLHFAIDTGKTYTINKFVESENNSSFGKPNPHRYYASQDLNIDGQKYIAIVLVADESPYRVEIDLFLKSDVHNFDVRTFDDIYYYKNAMVEFDDISIITKGYGSYLGNKRFTLDTVEGKKNVNIKLFNKYIPTSDVVAEMQEYPQYESLYYPGFFAKISIDGLGEKDVYISDTHTATPKKNIYDPFGLRSFDKAKAKAIDLSMDPNDEEIAILRWEFKQVEEGKLKTVIHTEKLYIKEIYLDAFSKTLTSMGYEEPYHYLTDYEYRGL